jgi:DNA repair and recombination protein RAD54B
MNLTNYRAHNQYLEKKKAGLAALEEWKHVNCLAATARDDVRDDILRQLILIDASEDATRDTPTLRAESLLSAVDLDRLCAAVKVKSVDEVPGGTITFVFEKTVDKIAEAEE